MSEKISREWSYSHYRSTLYRNGVRYAIVTPDGRNSLDTEKERELLRRLNNFDQLRRALIQIGELTEKQQLPITHEIHQLCQQALKDSAK